MLKEMKRLDIRPLVMNHSNVWDATYSELATNSLETGSLEQKNKSFALCTKGELCEEDLYSKKVKLSHFEILKVIGRGSFGKVFLVKHIKSGQWYAMKSVRKENLKSTKEKINWIIERTILEKVDSHFIVRLHFAFQTPDKVYYVVDYMQGGDLYYHMQRNHKLNEKRTKFYIAEWILALHEMHGRSIVYRDLKLENIMLDHEGHLRITDFGLCRLGINKENMAYSFVGTPEYLSPEVIKGTGYDQETDWWSLGCIMAEMLMGRSPFYHKNQEKVLENILFKDIDLKDIYSTKARDLVQQLLNRDPNKRLGSKDGAIELMQHPFFKDIDWKKLSKKQVIPPYKPKVKNNTCVKYFSQEYAEEEPHDSLVCSNLTTAQKKENHFDQFTYGQEQGVLAQNNLM